MKRKSWGKRIVSFLSAALMVIALGTGFAKEVPAAANGQGLADGSYTVTGTMLKVDKKSASMSNGAIDHTIRLNVSGGTYRVTMKFTGLNIGNRRGYLSRLKYFQTGYTLDAYGNPQGTLADTTVDSYITNADGSRLSDSYGTDYPEYISFQMIPEAKSDGYVPLQVFVPVMEAIATGNGTQPVFLKLDWSTLKSTSASVSGFADVSASAYYYDAVNWAVQKGITSGTTKTTFSPNAACTRGQMVQFLYRLNGAPAVSGSTNFTDIPSNAFYRNAVIWAVQNGITGGTTKTTFSPNAACTRGQMAQFLYRMSGAPAVSGSTNFTDIPSNAFYRNAVIWAVQKGITGGTTPRTYSPNANCTRGQMAQFLYKLSA